MASVPANVFVPFLHDPNRQSLISIQGIPQTNGTRVSISLINNATGHHIFHMALWYQNDTTTIVLNTSGASGWDEEVVFRNINLVRPNQRFQASVVYDREGYHVMIDNSFNYYFRYRYDETLSDRLVIEGQVLLETVRQS